MHIRSRSCRACSRVDRDPVKDISWWRLFWLYIVVVFTLEIILATFFSITSGIIEVFPYLYILPIILLARTHPRYAIYFTIGLGWIYLGLVYFFMPFEITAFASSIAWFYIFVTVGVVVSSLAESSQQEKKFREMFDNALAGIFAIDTTTGMITQINQRTATMLGYLPTELTGTSLGAIWPDGPGRSRFIEEVAAGSKTEPVEITLGKKDGQVIWVLMTASLAGSSRIVFSVIDITEQKSMRDELIESELRYHMIFDRATDAIFIHDIAGKIIIANQIASRMSGYPVKKLQELSLQDLGLIPGGGLTPAQNTELQSKGHYLFESLLMARDGTPVPVEISSKILEYSGRPAILSAVRDITERRHAQAALIESEMRYRMTGDLIPFGVWACDAKGNFTYLSESFLSVLGTTLDDCRKNGWMHRLPREDADRTIADWRQCVQTGSFWDYEYRIIDKNKRTYIVLSRGAPHVTGAGTITSWVGIHLDITERKRYEERLETSLKEKEVIIKEVHHRVKNNMQVISGFLELQSNYVTDPVAVEKLGECQRRVRTMALVHERLYQSRSLGVINAADYIKSLVEDLMNSYSLATLVDVTVEIDDVSINLDMAIPCGLIINELVTNSLKYAFAGRESGTLSVSLHHRSDHMFCLVVKDNGVGLPADFETRSKSSLGMQLVGVLVHQLGGEMQVTHEPGAQFSIVFPEKF
ncbi:MAG: PAS domain S-box protein [Methanomicrobiales archaeon]|nr:PAS domain S-box protein [Methanomicrobiales archaeon]